MQYAVELLVWMLVIGLTGFLSAISGTVCGCAFTSTRVKEDLEKYKRDYLDAMYGVPRNG